MFRSCCWCVVCLLSYFSLLYPMKLFFMELFIFEGVQNMRKAVVHISIRQQWYRVHQYHFMADLLLYVYETWSTEPQHRVVPCYLGHLGFNGEAVQNYAEETIAVRPCLFSLRLNLYIESYDPDRKSFTIYYNTIYLKAISFYVYFVSWVFRDSHSFKWQSSFTFNGKTWCVSLVWVKVSIFDKMFPF